MKPLDWETRQKAQSVLWRAEKQGRDAAEYLDAHGLLATKEWKSRVQAEFAQELADELRRRSVPGVVGAKYAAGTWTPQDLLEGVIAFVDRAGRAARELY